MAECITGLFGTTTAWTGTNNNIFNGEQFSGNGDFCTNSGGGPALDALGASWDARNLVPQDYDRIFGIVDNRGNVTTAPDESIFTMTGTEAQTAVNNAAKQSVIFQLAPTQDCGCNNNNTSYNGYTIQNVAPQTFSGQAQQYQYQPHTPQGSGYGQYGQPMTQNEAEMLALLEQAVAYAQEVTEENEALRAQAGMRQNTTSGNNAQLSDSGIALELLHDPSFLEFLEGQQQQGFWSFLGQHKRMSAEDIAKAARAHYGPKNIPDNITKQFDTAAISFVENNRDNVDDWSQFFTTNLNDRGGDDKVSIADTKSARDREIILAANPEIMDYLNSPKILESMRELADNGLDGKELTSLIKERFGNIPENELEMICNEFIDRVRHENDDTFVEWNGYQMAGVGIAGYGIASAVVAANLWNPIGWGGAVALGAALFFGSYVFGEHGDGKASTNDIDNYIKHRQAT